jgi:hypothetical protein
MDLESKKLQTRSLISLFHDDEYPPFLGGI